MMVAGFPDTLMVVRDCGFATSDEIIMAVEEWVVTAVPIGVEVVERCRVLALDENPPVDFRDVRD